MQDITREWVAKAEGDFRTGRFIVTDYGRARPFASFLPGVAGVMGIPLWAFYVNRAQAIAGFGVATKDNPIMEFYPADRAYQTTPYVGFRTFLKLRRGDGTTLYEPFAPWEAGDALTMFIGMNELELQAVHAAHGVQTNVLYFILPGEPFAALARQTTVMNSGGAPLALEMLDGLARVVPYGAEEGMLKHMSYTGQSWMTATNLDQRVPFYRTAISHSDRPEVEEVQAGHFYVACTEQDGRMERLPVLVDPAVVFGQNTAMHAPDRFAQRPLAELLAARQICAGRTPCGFCGIEATLEPGETLIIHSLIGHAGSMDRLPDIAARLADAAYLPRKRDEARELTARLTDVVETRTASPLFDAYCRQNFLDNVLRGGWPTLAGPPERPFVYHIYSRKHGDMERDYNYFYLAPEPYSQGNGNYRDVNQNRRCDVLAAPEVGDFNIIAFLSLIQADGYNPLVVNGVRFTLAPERRAEVLALVERPEKLSAALSAPFTPGGLLKLISDQGIGLRVAPETFIAAALTHAEQHFDATFGEGYWIDHWFYNLDLIETFLAVYPDRKAELLFERTIPYFDSPGVVLPRERRCVLAGDRVRQYGMVTVDEEKSALLAARAAAGAPTPNLARTARGWGEIYRATVFAKLTALALLKFATLDPCGMGVEMEAGKPGWYDALNGLPGLFGSSLCETYELLRLLDFLLEAMEEQGGRTVDLPVEQAALLAEVERALAVWNGSDDADRDFRYWEAVATARESYRARTRLGFEGRNIALGFDALTSALAAFREKVRWGIARAEALNGGFPPTYFAYNVTEYEPVADDPRHDAQGRPYVVPRRFAPRVLPLFLEGPVHALKIQPDAASARHLHERVRASALFDPQLNMYKLNASLADESHEIGRARAFTPGWLENESVWLHMEYKYLLELLKAGLHEEFFADARRALVPFLDPATYGRSPLENSSFIVSSVHPDESLHGAGFYARLSGATAEFLHMWSIMMAGPRPFFVEDGELRLALRPALPGWLFDEQGEVAFRFLGRCTVVYHNPQRVDTFAEGVQPRRITLHIVNGDTVELPGPVIGAPYAEWVRKGWVERIHVWYG